MTLLQHFAFKADFVIVATDTLCREERYEFNFFTGKAKYQVVRVFDREDKASVLTDKIIFSSGGYIDHALRIYKRLKRKIEPHYDLDDSKDILKEVCTNYANRYRNTRFEQMWKNNSSTFVVYLTGFRKDGTAAVLSYSPFNELEESPQLNEELPIYFELFAPTQDIYDMQANLYAPEQLEPLDSPLNTFVSHMGKVHAIIGHVQPKEVSPKCIYHVLKKDPEGKIQYLHKLTELSGLQQQLPPREELLEYFTKVMQ